MISYSLTKAPVNARENSILPTGRGKIMALRKKAPAIERSARFSQDICKISFILY